jgi:dihydropyrimidine dehydrogenase (NAD+) subunit PreT
LRHFRKGCVPLTDGARRPQSEDERMAVDVFSELVPPLEPEAALLEADACLECGTRHAPAPCAVACPAGIDVPGFVGAIARGDAEGAARLIFAENLLGGTCARVCPVETLCEGACVLEHDGRRPIAIGRLQRFATDTALGNGFALAPARAPTGRRVAVVGAGPAGLACAGELALLGHDVTVFDARGEIGGLVRFAIAPYRQLRDPLPQEAALLARIGVRFELGHPLDIESLRALEQDFDACVLAVGLGDDLDVRYPGDELDGVWDSLPFVEALKTTRYPPDVGERVVVIGGGNTAIDIVREAVRLGAGEVTLVYRRSRTEMPAYPHEVEEAFDEGVKFEWLALPVRIVGERRVEGVECVRMRLGPPDASGRPKPEPVPGSEFVLPADTVVKALGQQSRRELDELVGIDRRNGRIVVDADGRATRGRWFAAGDATNGGATVVEAVRGAKIAARGVHELLEGTP